MDIHHIRYFLAVCDTLNFTRAAAKCNVTQPALSRAIQQLEKEVGGLLFRRERNLTHPTDLAHLVKPRLQQVMEKLAEAERDAKRFLTIGQANVSLGIMCTIGPTLFTRLLSSFQSQHPTISLQLIEGVPDTLCKRLHAGEIDVAIMSSAEGFADSFVAEQLYQERFVVAFPIGHKFAQLSEIPLSDVHGESYLDRYNCEYQGRFSELMQGCGCSVNVVYESEREDWIQNMVAGGLGICFMPEFSAVVPGVQTRPVCDPEVWREICLVGLSGRAHSPAVTTFMNAVRKHPWPESRYLPEPAVA